MIKIVTPIPPFGDPSISYAFDYVGPDVDDLDDPSFDYANSLKAEIFIDGQCVYSIEYTANDAKPAEHDLYDIHRASVMRNGL